jgi:hypothetical protein
VWKQSTPDISPELAAHISRSSRMVGKVIGKFILVFDKFIEAPLGNR